MRGIGQHGENVWIQERCYGLWETRPKILVVIILLFLWRPPIL